MAIDVIEHRLKSIRVPEKRSQLALHLAETCYECFSVENLFRELIDCDPDNLDTILTALVSLEISLKHIADHVEWLERPLSRAIAEMDKAHSKASRR